MTGQRKLLQIKRLAKACKTAYSKKPRAWIDDEGAPVFDFPNYGGLPARVCGRLSSDCVDVIQMYNYDLANTKPRRFSYVALEKLLFEYHVRGYEIP